MNKKGMKSGMKVFGYIRFSYFGRNDTRISREIADDEVRFAALFDPERMEDRFYFFEKITLASLRTQTDPDFKVIVLCSTIMPDAYKLRLEALVADVPQIEVHYGDAPHISEEVDAKMAELTDGHDGPSIHFRMDDDDAIAKNIIELLKQSGRHQPARTLLTFPRGLYLAVSEDQAFVLRKFEPYIAIAWALVSSPRRPANPYRAAHGSHHKRARSAMEPRPFAYIHVAHGSSDTVARQERRLRKAIAADESHGTDQGARKTDKIIAEAFPGQSIESLSEIALNAPSRIGTKPATEISLELPKTTQSFNKIA